MVITRPCAGRCRAESAGPLTLRTMRNDSVLPLIVCSVISAGLLLFVIFPYSSTYPKNVLLSDVDTDAAFDELRSLEHTTSDHTADRFNTAFSGMKALEKFADKMMHEQKEERHGQHVSRVKTSVLRRKGASKQSTTFPVPP